MKHLEPPIPRRSDVDVLALCQNHLAREEALLGDMLASLRLVRAAFVERELHRLEVLQLHQEQLAGNSQEIAQAREQLRESLAPLLGVAPDEATLRAAALSLDEPARGQLLQRRDRLVELIREADQLNHHNAALLGYARAFLSNLFASLTGTIASERYGPRGEPRGALCGSFLEARG